MLSIIAPILLAILSSGAWLAYKHPAAYKKLKLPSKIFICGLFYVCVYLIWHFASKTTSGALLPYIDQSKTKEAKEAISALTFTKESIFYFLGVWNGLWLYAYILSHLRDFIEKAENKD
jgi:hypothetical protein